MKCPKDLSVVPGTDGHSCGNKSWDREAEAHGARWGLSGVLCRLVSKYLDHKMNLITFGCSDAAEVETFIRCSENRGVTKWVFVTLRLFVLQATNLTNLHVFSVGEIGAIWASHHNVRCFPSVSARQTPHPSLKAVAARSSEWSWVTICIKSLITGTVWTCAACVSAPESTAGFCTWTCWWAVTLHKNHLAF